MAEEGREIRRVANAHQKTPGPIDKFFKTFLSEDAKDVVDIIYKEKFDPWLRRTVIDFFEIILFGSSSRGGSRRYYGSDRHVSYDRYYDDDYDRRGSTRRVVVSSNRHRFAYMDCEFDTLGEVTDTIEEITDYLREYKFVSVAKLNNAIGITGDWTDKNWGWNDARDFRWDRRGKKYILDFAPPIPAND